MAVKHKIRVHIIKEESGAHFRTEYVSQVPNPGDEIRLGGIGEERYYKVTRVVWVFDEPECEFQRVNIGVKSSE